MLGITTASIGFPAPGHHTLEGFSWDHKAKENRGETGV